MRKALAIAAVAISGAAAATAISGSAQAASSQSSYAFIASSRAGAVVYVNGQVKEGTSSTNLQNAAGRVVYLQRLTGAGWQNLIQRQTGTGAQAGHLTVGFSQTRKYSYRWVAPATDTAAMAISAATTPPAYQLPASYAFIASSRTGAVVYVNGQVKQGTSTTNLQNSAGRILYLQRQTSAGWQNLVARRTGTGAQAGHLTVGFRQTAGFAYRWVVPAIASAAAAVSSASTPPAYVAPAPPVSSPPPTEVYYANCDAVRAAGKAPLYRGQPGYRAGLDRDGDGVACETD